MSLPVQETNKSPLEAHVAPENTQTGHPSVLLSVHTDFSSVEHVWRRFEQSADCYAFQTFDFLETWYRHVGARTDMEPQIVVAWGTSAKPLMILPLAIKTSGSLRRLVWLGNGINDYNAPLLGRNFSDHVAPGTFPQLWADIRATLPAHDITELMCQPAFVESQANPFMELGVSLNASGAHMTTLSGDFDTYYNEKRSSRAKKHFRNRRKKLQEIGETEYVHPTGAKDIAASVERLTELKSDALTAMGAHDFLSEPGVVDFYKELSTRSGANGFAHVSHLEVAGQYVAGTWGLVHKGRFYYLLASYDGPNFGTLAPGTQALVETMRWASEQGIGTFDFTVGDETYKSDWCETQIELHDYLEAQSLRGTVTLISARLFLSAKRTIKQSPVLWKLFTKMRSKLFAGK